jgi:hypothetical protein
VRDERETNDPNFDGQVFYIAFDIVVNTVLLPSDCEVDACAVVANPICKP